MISIFGSFEKDSSLLEPINSISCAKLLIDDIHNQSSNLNELRVQDIAWMGAKFPRLEKIEVLKINNYIKHFIFEEIVLGKDDNLTKYIKQIKNISGSNFKLELNNEDLISIDKSNYEFGVFTK